MLVLASFLFSYCRNYEKPVLIIPQKTDSLPIVTVPIYNQIDVSKSIYVFLSGTNKTLNFSVNLNDSLNTNVYFGIPFYPKVAQYYFLNNMKSSPTANPSHFFGFNNKNSIKDTCSNFIPFNWGFNPYFVQVNVDEIQTINSYYIFSGSFNLYLIRKCDSGSDTLFVKNAVFKNITFF